MSSIEPVISLVIVWAVALGTPLFALRWLRSEPLLAGISLVAGGLVASFLLQSAAIAQLSIACGMLFLLVKHVRDASKSKPARR